MPAFQPRHFLPYSLVIFGELRVFKCHCIVPPFVLAIEDSYTRECLEGKVDKTFSNLTSQFSGESGSPRRGLWIVMCAGVAAEICTAGFPMKIIFRELFTCSNA